MTDRNIGNLAILPDIQGTPEEAVAEHQLKKTFDSPKMAAEHCGLILRDIQSVGELSRAAMKEGYAEAKDEKIDLGTYTTRMQEVYDKAKKDIDSIIKQLAAIQANIEDPLNTFPAEQKTLILNVIRAGLEEANRSKEVIINELGQQQVRRPHQEEVEKNLDKTREAYAIAAAAGTLPVGETNPERIEPLANAAIDAVQQNKRPDALAEDLDKRAVQYEDAELRARALGLTKLLEERLANVDAILEAQAKRNEYQQGFLYKACDFLASYKLIANNDWRDPAKSGLPARFVGNITAGTFIKLALSLGALGTLGTVTAAGAGFGGTAAGVFMIARSAVSGVMGYFAGEKFARGYVEGNAIAAGSQEIPVPEDDETLQKVTDEQLADLIARMEYKALISGKSLRATAATTEAGPTTNEAIIDPKYKRLIEELQRRSEMDTETARSYAVSLETKIRQANAQLRELLQDREKVDQVAKIGGLLGAAAAVFLPAMFRGGLEASGWVGGPDGSFTHGTLAGLVGKDRADWATGTGGYSPDASAAVSVGSGVPGTGTAEAAAKTVANTTTPTTPSGPPPAPAYANTMGQNSLPSSSAGWRNPLAAGNSPELSTNATAQAIAAAEVPTPDAGSFVPAQTDFDKYIIGKIDINDAGVTPDKVNNGFSYIFKRQLMDHAQEYGWDGNGDKEKWAMKKLMSLMKEVKINGKSVYDAQQLWATDNAVGKAYILEMDGNGKFSVDVYQKSGANWISYDGQGADTQVMPLENTQNSGSGSGGAGHQPNGSVGNTTPTPNQAPVGPNAAPAPQFDQNGNSLTGGPSARGPVSGDLAPHAQNKVQWYNQSPFKSEAKYKEWIANGIETKSGSYGSWRFDNSGNLDTASSISQELRVNHLLQLDKAGSTGLQFSDSFRTIKDFTGTVPNSVKEQLFHPNHPPFTGKFGRLADEYAQLVQAEWVLDHARSLNSAIISPSDVTLMKKAIAKELEERVKRLLEFEGALKEDIRPARIFGNN